jgi:phage-related protein
MACLSYGPKVKKGLAERFFCTAVGHIILILHAFIKKSQQTPRRDLELARRRLREVRRDNPQ